MPLLKIMGLYLITYVTLLSKEKTHMWVFKCLYEHGDKYGWYTSGYVGYLEGEFFFLNLSLYCLTGYSETSFFCRYSCKTWFLMVALPFSLWKELSFD